MNEETKNAVYRVTAGGVAGRHAADETGVVLAAPSASKEFNTVKAGIIPLACWRLEDVRFEFDSSFIAPSAAEEFQHLALLRREHPGAPLSIFGHADPVGQDDYNKQLSGRRAAAVYAMLTRDTDIWEGSYSTPMGGDDWGLKAIQSILSDLGYYAGAVDGERTAATQEALKRYQSENGLPASGENDKQTRAKLFRAYMDRHCRDEQGNPFCLEKEDFLARGADPGGKGDYQGCSEFNPVLMFSQQENAEYSRPENRTERNAENAPNRRVVIYLFRPRLHIRPSSWPCPSVREGVAGCRKRFWSDASRRRSCREERREYDKTHDTFACRFYDRLASHSPCESVMRVFRIRLLDGFARPIPFAPYRISAGPLTVEGRADAEGWAFAKDVKTPERATVAWGFPPLGNPPNAGSPFLPYRLQVNLDLGEGGGPQQPDMTEGAAQRRLHNLGYSELNPLKSNILAFQRDYGLEQTGELRDIQDLLRQYHDSASPAPLPDSSNPESDFHE